MNRYFDNCNRRNAIKKIAFFTIGAAACSLVYGDNSKSLSESRIDKKREKILSLDEKINLEKGNNVLFYFSGTGNSLKVAQDIAQTLLNCEIIPISKYHKKIVDTKYDRIGIVCPVYAYGPPVIVLEFIENLTLKHKDAYIFCAITYRDDAGATLKIVENKLEKRNLNLNAGFGVKMPGNHIAYYDSDDIELQNQKFKAWEEKLKDITPIIIQKKEFLEDDFSIGDRVIKSTFLYSLASRRFRESDKKFELNSNCNGCKICLKVCPVNNIEFQNNKPVWKNNCEQCLACLSWCPKESIDFGRKTEGRQRYHHPKIQLKQMII